MEGRGFRGDWVDLAALLIVLTGAIDFFEGLIAVVRDDYYSFDPSEIIVVDFTAWGWILLLWGSVVTLIGIALWLRSSIARWVAVVVVAINVIGELAFAGSSNFPLWSLVANALAVVILYALILRWDGTEARARA